MGLTSISQRTNTAESPLWPLRRFVIGVDLGQAHDPTAIAVIEKRTEPKDDWSSIDPKVETINRFEVRHLERLPLGSGYPAQVQYIQELSRKWPLGRFDRTGRMNTDIVIDMTGVGRPVFDIFATQGVKATGVTITAGQAETRVSGGYRVAKLALVSRLQAMLHSGDLKIASDLPETTALVRELQDFRATFSSVGNPIFGAREGTHDDLVLAVAIGVWFAARGRERGRQVRLAGL